MTDHTDGVKVTMRFSGPVADSIEAFRSAEGLVGTAEAVRLLVEIGVDTVSARGRRFWDSKPADQPSD
jgi:hypothetical protein